MKLLIYLSLLLLSIKGALALFPLRQRQLHHWENNTSDALDYCQNLKRLTMEYEVQGKGYSCGCGVSNGGFGSGFFMSCDQQGETCYVLSDSYLPGPRVTTSFASEITADGNETFQRCMTIKDYDTVDDYPSVRDADVDADIKICIRGATDSAHEDATCSATVNFKPCNSCEVIPCLFFLRPEFLLDCGNEMYGADRVDTCRKTGMSGTPFVFWEPGPNGVEIDDGPYFGRCSGAPSYGFGSTLVAAAGAAVALPFLLLYAL